MYKIFKIRAETFAKNVHTIKVNTTDNKSVLLIKMIDIQKKLNVKSIHDLVDKEIKGKLNTNNLTNEQIKKYKRHGSELIINQQQKLMNQVIMIEILTMKYKEKEQQKKNLVVCLLELIMMKNILTFLKP